MSARKKESIYLLTNYESGISGGKLPSNGQVLRFLLYNKRKVNLETEKSAELVIKQVESFWLRAQIPIRETRRSIEKLLRLYDEYVKLHKNKSRKDRSQKQKEKSFCERFEDLFDIAHGDALNLLKSEKVKTFLFSQRQKGRIGCLDDITGVSKETVNNASSRKKQSKNAKKRKLGK